MIKIQINNQQEFIELTQELEDFFQEIANKTASIEGYSQGEISIALLDNQEIQKLNKQYREKDMPTDVLSFIMDEEIWGDIVISTEQAIKQAEDYNHSIKRELAFLTVHGILHLLGYDHQTPGEREEMRRKEERVLSELNLSRDSE
ncbi:MAG: rRNA maturation RNase YbeY [Halanaerobiales bacterium]